MPLIDDSGRRITGLSAPKSTKAKPKKTTSSSFSGGRYTKPTGNSQLPKWAQEIRAGSNFMPMRVKPISYTELAKAEGMAGNTFRPRAYQPVTVPTAPTDTVTTVGTKFFKPTEEVTKGIKQEFNLWQDIKNMGGKIVHKGGSLLMGALDLLARPKYALMNVYKDKLERHYTTEDSAGGADVTGGEALKGFLGMLNPFGVIKDVASGEFDDTVKAAVSGFTGKSKVFAKDIMEITNPEFTKAHPLGSSILGIVGDITFDPLTWLTMGLNPGSVGRAGVSGAKLAMGDKLAAQRLWNETLFTKSGRAAGTQTVKSHIKQQELKKLNRQSRRAGARVDKATAKAKPTEQALRDKHQLIKDAIDVKIAEDLKGADLAWKVFKKSLPTAGIFTASRFNTGAGTSTMNLGKTLLTDLHADFNWGVAEDFADEPRWNAYFAANNNRDFEYTHGGVKHTLKFSEDKNVKDFIFRVSKESNPIASFKTGSTKKARSRKGDIETVEARAQSFRTAFREHMDDSLHKALKGEESKAYGAVQGMARAKPRVVRKADPATKSDLKNDTLITVKEEDFHDVNTTYETLRDAARAQHEKAMKGKSEGSRRAFVEDKAYVLYEGVEGTKKIKLSTLRKAARSEEATRAKRLQDKGIIAKRTPTQKSVDQMTGVSDAVAAGRARLIEAGTRARVRREVHNANLEEIEAHHGLHKSVAKSIDDSDEFTDAEKIKYHDILKDTSKPLDERIAAILRESTISNVEANEILDDVFRVTIDSAGNIHIPKGGTIDDIPTIIRAVIKDRFEHRITGTELEHGGTSLAHGPDGAIGIVQKAPPKGTVNFTRDINNELGMMILDGYRVAARYAAETDMFKDNPEILFDTIHRTTSEFMNMATADTKRQVIQIMYNMSGMRLPEKFVPSVDDVARLLGKQEHKFVNGVTGKELPNQTIPWENLGVRMQTWVTDLFGFAPTSKFSAYPRSGMDMASVKKSILARSDELDNQKQLDAYKQETVDAIEELMDHLDVLHYRVDAQFINGTEGVVNRYSYLDFILHSDEILKAQGTRSHFVNTPQGMFGRQSAGRLSALDSFTFVDDETKAGLEALTKLKRLAKGADDPELKRHAQNVLAGMFVDNGGMKFIDDVSMPPSGSLKDANLGEAFSTLGAHARLKEGSLRRGSGIETGHAVQLLDSMWAKVTVNHELQKAFQNAILHGVWVKGQKEAIVAENLVKNIDNFFAPFDNIKKALYPVTSKKGLAPKGMLEPNPVITGQVGKAAPAAKAKAGLLVDYDVQARLDDAKAKLKEAVEAAQKIPKLEGTTAQEELAAAREEYVRLLKASDDSNPAEPVEVAPGGAEAGAADAGAPKPPTGTDETPTGDPADFVNNVNTDYTPEEIEAIRSWIGIKNNEGNPEVVARQLHAFSNAIASDLILAQQQMISNMADMTLKYGANVRFMGIPFMPMFNPMNATHTMAGVVAFDQYKGSGNKFFLSVVNKIRGWERGENMYKNFSRPSHYLEGSLETVRQTVVNSVGELRKRVIKQLDTWYETALATKYDSLPQVNGMSRKAKLNHFKQSLFKPEVKGAADPIGQYKLADGSNPVNDIAANMHDSASAVFKAKADTVNGQKLRAKELEIFNRFMIEEYRLTGEELALIAARTKADPEFAKIMPYSREWLREVGQMSSTGKLRTERLLKTNLGKLHYSMQDAKLKYHAGAALNHGVFEQFAFRMDDATAAMHNKKVVGATVGANGEPLRGPVVLISKDTIGTGTEWGIETRHIPAEFLDKGYYISTDFLPEINTMFKYMDEVSKLNETITVGYLNKILAYFKASVTIYKVPSYPVRNLIGDVFMSAFDGLVNPRYYKDAARLQMDFHEAMKQISTEQYTKVFDKNFLARETQMGVHDPATVLSEANLPKTPYSLHLVMADGTVELNGSQVMEAYYKMGLGQNRVAGEIAENVKGARQTGISKGFGKVHDLLRNTNDVREDWARLSHFLYAMEREAPLGGGFEDVIRRAGARVIKHHFDYNDVSLVERQRLANWIPFYKWVRNIIPYTIATVVTKPVALKAESATQAVIGHLIDDDKTDNRVDYVMPEWLEFDSPVSIGSYTDDNNNEFGQYMSLAMPLSDTLKRTLGPAVQPLFDPTVEGPGNKALEAGAGGIGVGMSMLNPIVKGLIQAPTGMELWPTGGAPEKGNWAKTMSAAIPGAANIDQFFKGKKGLEGVNGQNLMAYWLDQLGAINMSNNSERSQLGELNKREDLYRGQLNKAKANLANMIQKKYPNSTPEQRKELVDAVLKESRKAPDSGRL